MNWVQNENEIDDIKEDENKGYIDNNKINIAEEELEDIENNKVNDLLSDMRGNDEVIRHTE